MGSPSLGPAEDFRIRANFGDVDKLPSAVENGAGRAFMLAGGEIDPQVHLSQIMGGDYDYEAESGHGYKFAGRAQIQTPAQIAVHESSEKIKS